ncbi:MAG: hypothetical protein AAF690_30660, partial [Acidobacteriota bacterium]
MARASVALLVLLAAAPLAANERAAPRCDPGKPHPDAPAELSEFAFLVGDYEITSHAWTGQGWSPPRPGARARWNGWYGMGGMMIYDEWYDPDPGLDPSSGRGVNVRLYDPEEKLWKMMWIATVGKQTQDLRAQVQDGKLVMWQVHPERPGFRAEFTVEDED